MNAASQPAPTTPAAARIRVLVADDHVTVREGLAAIISRQPDMDVVAEAANGEEAFARWTEFHPTVTLMDLRMPLLDGLGAIKQIRAHDGFALVVVLTTYDTDQEILNAIKAGARAYLLKDAPREVLLDTIRRVARGETCVPASLVDKLAGSLGQACLTEREQHVLELMAEGKSNKEIGSLLFIGETTVKSHLRSVFRKLNVLSRTEALAVATKRGLVKG